MHFKRDAVEAEAIDLRSTSEGRSAASNRQWWIEEPGDLVLNSRIKYWVAGTPVINNSRQRQAKLAGMPEAGRPPFPFIFISFRTGPGLLLSPPLSSAERGNSDTRTRLISVGVRDWRQAIACRRKNLERRVSPPREEEFPRDRLTFNALIILPKLWACAAL
jgi:hypothetical protein